MTPVIKAKVKLQSVLQKARLLTDCAADSVDDLHVRKMSFNRVAPRIQSCELPNLLRHQFEGLSVLENRENASTGLEDWNRCDVESAIFGGPSLHELAKLRKCRLDDLPSCLEVPV